jgi:indoleamine 2,3-dioxygenase
MASVVKPFLPSSLSQYLAVLLCEYHPSRTRTSLINTRAGFKPFMEYAGSYALFNYRLQDPKRGLEYDNLRLIRAFEHGLDPKSSEAGFVLVHVDMVQNSGPLVDGVVSALEACEHNDREAFNTGMEKVVISMTKVNKVMESEYIQ